MLATNYRLRPFSLLLAVCLVCQMGRCEEPADLVKNAKRIGFLGDSITAAGRYITFLDLWLETQGSGETHPTLIDLGLPSETVSGLSEEGHAGGQFPRPDLAERLDRVLAVSKPDLVFACYGMNCGIYLPFDEGRFQKYQNGILSLKEKVEKSGAKIVFITPACFDDLRGKKDFSYNEVLGKYSDWLVSQKGKGWAVIDLHKPMTKELMLRREQKPDFTFQPDAVHPNEEGHWFIAKQLLIALGEPKAGGWATAADMLQSMNLKNETLKLVDDRMKLLRDSYVSAAGHLRPGVAKGLPVEDATSKSKLLTETIRMQIKSRGSL